MSKQTINIGASPNDGTGTPLRTSFDYCNQNFTELYTATGPSGNNIVVPGNATITGDLTVDTSTLKVDSTNDRVGVGTASPATRFHVALAAATYGEVARFYDASGNGISLTANGSSGFNQITSTAAQPLIFNVNSGERYRLGSDGTATWSVAGTTAMTLNTTGNLVLKGGTVGATGVGVTFPATQVASSDANCLDDYEEGTWTPTIVGTTTAGAGTYSLQAGLYTKIGNRVFVEGYISWSAHTGTGNMRIGGLPFTINSSSFYSSGSIGDLNAIALTAGNILAILGVATSATIDMKQLPTGGGASSAVPIDVAANISFSLCYLV